MRNVNGVAVKYYRRPNGTPGRGDPHGLVYAKIEGSNIRLGLSRCASVDRFTRAEARRIAQETFDKGDFIFPLENCFTIPDQLPRHYRDMAYDIRFAIREAIQFDYFRIRKSLGAKFANFFQNTVLG